MPPGCVWHLENNGTYHGRRRWAAQWRRLSKGLVSLYPLGMIWDRKAGNPPTMGQQSSCTAARCARGLVGWSGRKPNPSSMGIWGRSVDAHLASPAWPSSTELCPWVLLDMAVTLSMVLDVNFPVPSPPSPGSSPAAESSLPEVTALDVVMARAVKLSIDLGKHNKESRSCRAGYSGMSAAQGRKAPEVWLMGGTAKPPMAAQGWDDAWWQGTGGPAPVG